MVYVGLEVTLCMEFYYHESLSLLSVELQLMAALLETCSDGIGTCSDVRLSVPMMWSRDGPNVNTIFLGNFVTMHDIGS